MNGQMEQVFDKMVENQINSENISAARDLFNRYGAYLGSNRDTLAHKLDEKAQTVHAEAIKSLVMPSDNFDPNTRAAAIVRGVAKGGLGIAQDLFTLGKAGIEGLGQVEGLGLRIADGITDAIKPDALPVDKPVTATPAISKWFGDMAQAATKAMYGKAAVADLRKTTLGRKIINSEGGMMRNSILTEFFVAVAILGAVSWLGTLAPSQAS